MFIDRATLNEAIRGVANKIGERLNPKTNIGRVLNQ